jgi:hypothetical protein
MNRESRDNWDPQDLGEVILDDQFVIGSLETQQSLVDFCENLKEQSFVVDGSVQCWIE